MEDKDYLQRLASLEAKMELIRELLKEIRDDIKNQPTREELNEVEDRVDRLEKSQISLVIKVGVTSGILGALAGYLVKLLA